MLKTRAGRARVLPVFLAFISWLIHCAADGQVVLTAGHAVGPTESLYASRLLERAAERIPGVEVAYKEATTVTFGRSGGRFDETVEPTDLLFVYAGLTQQLDEITFLAREGHIQPLDALPNFSKLLKPEDIYSNLLDAALFSGHLWAIPVRVCPPCLASRTTASFKPKTWEGLVDMTPKTGFVYGHPSDFYMLWLTLTSQRELLPFGHDRYDFSPTGFSEDFQLLSKVYASGQIRNWQGMDVGLVVPDDFASVPGLKTKAVPHALPGREGRVVYPRENSWFISVSGMAVGEKREAAGRILAELLSPPMQLRIAAEAFSPPVRPSIAEGREFRNKYAVGSIQRVLSEMTPRLRFRSPGETRAKAEAIIEEAFLKGLASPANFPVLIAEAEEKANRIIKQDK